MNFKFHIVLIEPEIPPNTGNIGRLCVATQSTLHLVGPLGFSLEDKALRRAGLDYWKYVDLKQHPTWEDWLHWRNTNYPQMPFYFFTKKTNQSFYNIRHTSPAAFIFGKETWGLPQNLIDQYPDQTFQVPMFSNQVRSLNLSNAVAIVLYEAVRQQL